MMWVAYGNTRSLAERKAGYKKSCSEDVNVCGYRKSLRKWMWVLEGNRGASIYSQTSICRAE